MQSIGVSPAASTAPPPGPDGGRSRPFNPATHYSPHFSRAEILRPLPGEPNAPTTAAEMELTHLCQTLAEDARTVLGVPMVVTSGYRGAERERRVQEGAGMIPRGAPLRGSQHMKGQALDFLTPALPLWQAYEALAFSPLQYDQLLFETYLRADGSRSCWIHISCAPSTRPPRRQAAAITETAPWIPYTPGLARSIQGV